MTLSPILASQNIERILLFLLLNGKCYASQLSRCFETPLTPLQQALQKLEDQKVIISSYEGKTRLFEFNPSYPLLHELEELLKKAYSHLNLVEKRLYYNPHFQTMKVAKRFPLPDTKKTLARFWDKLPKIQALALSAKSKSTTMTGWNGLGKGTVEVTQSGSDCIVFQEHGRWISIQDKEMEFRNVFRWTLHKSQGVISLEHLRFGSQNPVFLFKLQPKDEHSLESAEAHHCKNDSYMGTIRCDDHFIQLNWRVIGPQKNEEIDYLYT